MPVRPTALASRGVELYAQGLDSFSRAEPSVVKSIQLPDWIDSARIAWPPQRSSIDPALFAPAPFNEAYTGNWWKASEARAQAQREEGARVQACYAEREREQREAAEAAARSRNGG